MTPEKWRDRFKNYNLEGYEEEFDSIVDNFAIQSEQQFITQNDDWFKPFLQYVVEHPQGTTVTKMLNEVNCPQLKATHRTDDKKLLGDRLLKGTKRVSKDVPPLFNSVPMNNGTEDVYTPTPYAMKLYGNDSDGDGNSLKNEPEELSFDDL